MLLLMMMALQMFHHDIIMDVINHIYGYISLGEGIY